MISEETWEKFRNGKVVFECKTRELWDKLMINLERRGYCASIAKGGYENYGGEGCGIDNESGVLGWSSINFYKRKCPRLTVRNVTEDDFKDPPVLTGFPQPPQELVNILRAIANNKEIEKTYGVQLELDSLYSKRDEYLAKWTSKFEVHI